MEDNTENITGQGQIDKDILQCKADILQAQNSSRPAKHQPAEPLPDPEPPKKTEPLRPVAENQQPTQETIAKLEDMRQNLEKFRAELETAKTDPDTIAGDEIEEIELDDINVDVQADLEIEEIGTDEKIEETLQIEADQEDSGQIPRFNLADQILSAQRKVASTRRQGPAANINSTGANIAPAEGTIGRIISESKKTVPDEPIELYQEAESPEKAMSPTPAPDEPIELYEAVEPDESYFRIGASSFDPAAAQIISEIVADDLQRLCGKYAAAGRR